MKTFIGFLLEVKKKEKKTKSVPAPPTIVSSPLRGANQDYSGISPGHDTADYTVSD